MSPQRLSPDTCLPANWVMVSGISSSDEAKIGGITPAVLILSGRWLRSGLHHAALRSGASDIGSARAAGRAP